MMLPKPPLLQPPSLLQPPPLLPALPAMPSQPLPSLLPLPLLSAQSKPRWISARVTRCSALMNAAVRRGTLRSWWISCKG